MIEEEIDKRVEEIKDLIHAWRDKKSSVIEALRQNTDRRSAELIWEDGFLSGMQAYINRDQERTQEMLARLGAIPFPEKP